MKQPSLFDIEQEERDNASYNAIRSKLKHYGIDEIYSKEFKGKTPLLREIYERLSKQTNYNDYMNDLINELLKVVPLVKEDCYFEKTGIFKYGDGKYGFTTTAYEANKIKYNGCTCPLYCLEMLPKIFFKVGELNDRNM
jgi:hypothetical protein